MQLLQLVEFPDRIFHPSMISTVALRPDHLYVTMMGGHEWRLDGKQEAEATYQSFKNGQMSMVLLEHERVLYNTTDIAMVDLRQNDDGQYYSRIYFVSGKQRMALLSREDNAQDFYQKWHQRRETVDEFIRQSFQQQQQLIQRPDGKPWQNMGNPFRKN